MMLTMLADVLRDAGLPVVEVAGWRTRTRPGGMIDVKTITCHHTGNGGASGDHPSLNVVIVGRKGSKPLPGPLSQLFLSKDGTWYVVAAGSANHPGVSLETRFTKPYAIGIEAEAVGVPGTAGDWPEVQMRSYARGCAALVDYFDLAVSDVRGHKETCKPEGRKSDPSFSMPAFRNRVAAVNLKAAFNQEDDFVPGLTADDVANAVWRRRQDLTASDIAAIGSGKDGDDATMEAFLRFPPAVARIRRELTDQVAKVKQQSDRLERQHNVTSGELAVVKGALDGQGAALVQLASGLQSISDQLAILLERLPATPES